jgi:hypothetical protein
LPICSSRARIADAIRQFRPKIVYPYHYRGADGSKANLAELKKLVGEDVGVEIRTPDWYSEP